MDLKGVGIEPATSWSVVRHADIRFRVYKKIDMEEPSDGLLEKQKHGRRDGRRWTSWAFGSGWTDVGCIDPIYI